MKHAHTPRTSSLFLLELIFSILFFSVASAVCVQVFVRAHILSRDARALSCAVTACSDAAEIAGAAKGAKDAAERLAAFYGEATVDAASEQDSETASTAAMNSVSPDNAASAMVTIGFDAELQECAADAAAYVLTAAYSEEGAMLRCEAVMQKADGAGDASNASVFKDEGVIYRLDTIHYLQGGDAQ